MYSSLEMETATSNEVGMSLTRIIFVDINATAGVYKGYKEYRPLSYKSTINTKVVNATMWSVPEVYIQLELLYGNKCRGGIFGGTVHVS